VRVLDLFSGIGGFSLGLERAGMRTVAFCEIDPYCRAVLRKHWPAVPIYDDVRTIGRIECDVICGGFPCQDVSIAQGSRRKGLEGEQSGLWREFARLIGEIRPRYVIVENTPGLLSLGMGEVLGKLAALGYDAEWHCIPAAAVGAPHIRDRLWMVGYPDSDSKSALAEHEQMARVPGVAADTTSIGLAIWEGLRSFWEETDAAASAPLRWAAESGLPRVVDGFPGRMDAVEAIGNAVVPQIPELIGRAIMTAENRCNGDNSQ
jgi:DNA (cytosine-5)-methyltransferase 1